MAWDWLDRRIVNCSRRLGDSVGKRAYVYLLIPIVSTVVLGTGFMRMDKITDITYLYTPVHAKSFQERAVVEQLFPMNLSTKFEPGRITRESSCGFVILEAKDGGSMLRKSILKDVLSVDKIVRNVSVVYKGKVLSYSDLCAKRKRKCYINDALFLAKKINDIESGKFSFRYPLDINPVTYHYKYYAGNLGGVETDSEGKAVNAKAIRLLYYLSDRHNREVNELWEDEFLRITAKATFDNIFVYRYTSQTVDKELLEMSRQGRLWMGIALMIMASSCFVFCVFARRTWMALSTNISASMAIVSAFGLLSYCGVKYIENNAILSFLVLASSVDDTYHLVTAWKSTDERKTNEVRMSDVYSIAVPSIIISTVTNVVFYLISQCLSDLPAFRIFSLYTVMCVIFTSLYSLTFNGAFLALCGEAERRNLNHFTCCPNRSNSTSDNKRTANTLQSKECNTNKVTLSSSKFDVYAAVNSHPTKMVIAFMMAIYIAVSAWSIATSIRIGAELTSVVSYNSYGGEFVKKNNFYFKKYPNRVQIVLNATLDYSNPNVRNEVKEIVTKMEHCKYIGDHSLTESWLKYYTVFLEDRRSAGLIDGIDVKSKEGFNSALKNAFLRLPLADMFRDDVKFSDDGKEILASRFVLQMMGVTLTDGQKEMVRELREIAASSPYHVVAYNYDFPHTDRLLGLVSWACYFLAVILVAHSLIIILVLGKVICSLCSALCLGSVLVGTVALLSLWNVNLNSAALMNILFILSLAIKYASHVIRTYVNCKDNDPQSSLRNVYCNVGLPVLQSAAPVVLGAIVIGFGPSYIFNCFFKVTFLIVTSSLFHFLLVFPTLMSFASFLEQACCSSKSGRLDLVLVKFHQGQEKY